VQSWFLEMVSGTGVHFLSYWRCQYTFGILNTLKRQQFHYDLQCIEPVDAGVSLTEATLFFPQNPIFFCVHSLNKNSAEKGISLSSSYTLVGNPLVRNIDRNCIFIYNT
jgi:hypothetical protein